MSVAAPLRVYWQPGCTSCLQAKEFLARHGVAFESVNVRTDPRAESELAALGVRTVPVIARGCDYVLGQDLDELARFVGIHVERTRLSPDELVGRLLVLLATTGSLLAALPPGHLATRLPQRERTWLDLGFHVFMIVQGLLEAARGGELTYEIYERRAPATWLEASPAIEFGRGTQRGLESWWNEARLEPRGEARTYFGKQPLDALLERTAWHVAQHVRQLEHLVHEVARVPGAPQIPAAALAGLPLPVAVWDREIAPQEAPVT
jgi:glutaredoxin